jgi:hypothetical protein
MSSATSSLTWKCFAMLAEAATSATRKKRSFHVCIFESTNSVVEDDLDWRYNTCAFQDIILCSSLFLKQRSNKLFQVHGALVVRAGFVIV